MEVDRTSEEIKTEKIKLDEGPKDLNIKKEKCKC